MCPVRLLWPIPGNSTIDAGVSDKMLAYLESRTSLGRENSVCGHAAAGTGDV
jgi:hypothetical protein